MKNSTIKFFQEGFKFIVLGAFIFFVLDILYLNLLSSAYIHNGYFNTTSPVSYKHILFSIVGTISIIWVTHNAKASQKFYLVLFVGINISFLLFRILLLNAFTVVPAGDNIQIFISIAELSQGIDQAFLKGGYISTYAQQLGYTVFMLPFFSVFKDQFIFYYIMNVIFLQSSILLLSFTFMKDKDYKSLFWIGLGLNLFIPNLFYQFVFYSDPLAMFVISLSLFIFMKSDLIRYKNMAILAFVLSLAMVIRAYSIVLVIAFFILIVFGYKSFSIKRKAVFTILMLFVATLPQKLLETGFNTIYKTEVGTYSLPSTTWLAIGLHGPGFTPEFINYFSSIDYDQDEMKLYLNDSIIESSSSLLNYDFWQSKINYSWTNQDFDSLSYLMPNEWGASLEAFFQDNSIRLGRASGDTKPTNTLGEAIYTYLFSLRNLEKIFLLMVLQLSLIAMFLNHKKKDEKIFLMELMFVGFNLLFVLLETQPRYLYIAVNLIVIYAFYALSTFELTFFRYNKPMEDEKHV